MQNILFIILAYIALVVQVTMSHQLEILTIQPHCLIAVLLVVCLQSGSKQALICAGCIGFLIDTISRGDLGVFMFVAILCTGILPADWFKHKNISLIKFTIRSAILCTLLIFTGTILKQVLTGTIDLNSELFLKALGTSFYTVTIASVLRQTGKMVQRIVSRNTTPIQDQETIYI